MRQPGSQTQCRGHQRRCETAFCHQSWCGKARQTRKQYTYDNNQARRAPRQRRRPAVRSIKPSPMARTMRQRPAQQRTEDQHRDEDQGKADDVACDRRFADIGQQVPPSARSGCAARTATTQAASDMTTRTNPRQNPNTADRTTTPKTMKSKAVTDASGNIISSSPCAPPYPPSSAWPARRRRRRVEYGPDAHALHRCPSRCGTVFGIGRKSGAFELRRRALRQAFASANAATCTTKLPAGDAGAGTRLAATAWLAPSRPRCLGTAAPLPAMHLAVALSLRAARRSPESLTASAGVASAVSAALGAGARCQEASSRRSNPARWRLAWARALRAMRRSARHRRGFCVRSLVRRERRDELAVVDRRNLDRNVVAERFRIAFEQQRQDDSGRERQNNRADEPAARASLQLFDGGIRGFRSCQHALR